MPEPREGESKDDYISRCIAYCIKEEGLTQEEAAGKCNGMWKEAQKQDDVKKPVTNMALFDIDKPTFIIRCCRYIEGIGFKPDDTKYFCNNLYEEIYEQDEDGGPLRKPEVIIKPGGNPPPGDGQYSAKRELTCLDCEDIQPMHNKPVNLSKKQPTVEDKDDFKATCVYGDRLYKGKFLPMKELQKAYKSLNGSYHDINHWGTTYLDGNPNIEYVVGYQDNVKLDNTTKALTADIHILKSAEKYQLWKGFVDINKKINKMPNVSVSFYSSRKKVKAKDLEGLDFAAHGYRGDDEIDYMYDLDFQALSTIFKGACSDKDGCGIGLQQDEPIYEDEQKQLLTDKIKRMKK